MAAVLQGAAEAAARAEAVQEADGSGVLPEAEEAAAQATEGEAAAVAAAVSAGVYTPRMRAQGAPAAVPAAPEVGGAAPPGAAPAPEVGTSADDELAGGGGGGGAHARREQAMAKQLEMARAITAGDVLDVFFSARTVSLCPTASPARRKQARPSYPTYPYGMSASRLSTLS